MRSISEWYQNIKNSIKELIKSFWVLEYDLVSDLIYILCIIIEHYNKWSYILDFELKEMKKAAKVL